MKLLSNVKDGEVLSMSMAQVNELQKYEGQVTKKTAKIFPDNLMENVLVETKLNPTQLQVVRYNHQWYIRGWTTQNPIPFKSADTAKEAPRIVFFNIPQANVVATETSPSQKQISLGPADKQVQIPVSLTSPDSTFESEGYTFSNVRLDSMKLVNSKHLDNHAWDKWTPPQFETKPGIPDKPNTNYSLFGQ